MQVNINLQAGCPSKTAADARLCSVVAMRTEAARTQGGLAYCICCWCTGWHTRFAGEACLTVAEGYNSEG
jgi:hypothetical protein